MPAGRPPIWDDPGNMYAAGEVYVLNCSEKDEIPTMAGLAHALGFESRQSLYAYQEKPEFCYVVKRLILLVEQYHEKRLVQPSCTGSIFWLKNHKWSDTQQFEHSGPNGGPLKVTVEFVK